MKMFTTLGLIAIAVASLLIYHFPFSVALGQHEPDSRNISLQPIHPQDETITKTFQKEFDEMLKDIESNDNDS